MRHRPSLIPTRRLLVWFWRHRVYRYFRMPICDLCHRHEATVRYNKHIWLCTQHPLFVSATQYGYRPRWRPWIYTRAGVDKLFGCDVKVASPPFWTASTTTGGPITKEDAQAIGRAFLGERGVG